MRKAYLGLILMLLTPYLFADEMSFLSDSERSLATTPWHVENKDGAMVCVPPPVVPHKKRLHRKVVKKVVVAPKCEEKVVEKVVEKQVVVEKTVREEDYKNRLSLLLGAGPYYGSALDHFGSSYSLSVQYLPMVGAQYERNLDFLFNTKRLTGTVGIFTNASWFVGAGYGF